jgi:hypothetical protein
VSNEGLEALFNQIPDGAMKDALRVQSDDFAEEVLLAYLECDSEAQADIEDFFNSGEPAKAVRRKKAKRALWGRSSL